MIYASGKIPFQHDTEGEGPYGGDLAASWSQGQSTLRAYRYRCLPRPTAHTGDGSSSRSLTGRAEGLQGSAYGTPLQQQTFGQPDLDGHAAASVSEDECREGQISIRH